MILVFEDKASTNNTITALLKRADVAARTVMHKLTMMTFAAPAITAGTAKDA